MVWRRRGFLAASVAVAGATGIRPAVAAPVAANGIDQILSLDKVHVIDIKADPADLHWLDDDRDHNVTCDVTIDGEKYKDANFSEKGDLGSSAKLAEKSGFNIRFGKDRPRDMKKLVVNNAKQDTSFVKEHVAYEIYRRAGLPATLTAHGAITLNGQPYGVFVMVEAKDTAYLQKWLGNGNGNFYEADAVDFADGYLDPIRISNHNDDETVETFDPTKRADLASLADAVNAPDDATFLGKIRERMDLDAFITHYALDALVASADGPMFNVNNYYLYHRPADNRMVMLPHGIDLAFEVETDVRKPPMMKLAQRVQAIPELETQWRSELNRVMDQAWNLDVLYARIDQVVQIFRQFEAPRGPIADEVTEVLAYATGLKNPLEARRAQWTTQPF